jgi:hypothetical protein
MNDRRPRQVDPSLGAVTQFFAADKAYDEALERRQAAEVLNPENLDGDATLNAAVDAAIQAVDDARTALFHTEPTTVLGVAALLAALAKNETCESPIEMWVNADAGGKVNDFLRRLASVLRDEA